MRGILFNLLVLAFISNVFAHTYLSSISIEGNALAEGDCVRPHPPSAKENPIRFVTDADMTCGWLPYAAQPANRKCPVSAGSTVGLQWYHNNADPEDDIIAATHLGPCLVYLAKSEDGSGPVWFKIFEEGYNPETKQWCVDKLRNNGGHFEATLPSDIAPGNYLMRGEILALHEGNVLNGVQPYVGCAELTVSGSGNSEPDGVPIPGVYSATDAGMNFDVYQDYSSYPIPGPSVYKPSSPPSHKPPISSPTNKPTEASPAEEEPAAEEPVEEEPAAEEPEYEEPVEEEPAEEEPVDEEPEYEEPAEEEPEAEEPAEEEPAAEEPEYEEPVEEEPAEEEPSAEEPEAPATPSVRVQLYPSSNQHWLAVTARSDPTTVAIEVKDADYYTEWTPLQLTSWGYWMLAAADGQAISLPVSVRLTSSTDAQLELPDVFNSWEATSFIDTGRWFGESTEEEATEEEPEVVPVDVTASPITAAPETDDGDAEEAPTVPSSDSLKMLVHEGSNEWWLAVAIYDAKAEPAAVEMLTADGTWHGLDYEEWGFWAFKTTGTSITVPITFRVTSANGQSVSFVLDEIVAHSLVDTGVQFI